MTQPGVRNNFCWKDLGWSCDAAGGEKQFLKGFRDELRRSRGENYFLEGFDEEL